MGFGDLCFFFLPGSCHGYSEEYGYTGRWLRIKAYEISLVLMNNGELTKTQCVA